MGLDHCSQATGVAERASARSSTSPKTCRLKKQLHLHSKLQTQSHSQPSLFHTLPPRQSQSRKPLLIQRLQRAMISQNENSGPGAGRSRKQHLRINNRPQLPRENQEKAMKTDGFGFIPGRSFVGRAIAVGYEVNGIEKRDWVMGLLDVRKVCTPLFQCQEPTC